MLKRAIWRQVALLLLVCVLPGCKRSAPVRTVSLSEIVTADSTVAGRGQTVRTTAIVTYSDPEWRLLFVEDGGLGMYIAPPPEARLESGDRIEITGKTAALGTGVEAPVISVLSRNNPLPPPLRLTDNSALKRLLSQFVEVTGIVLTKLDGTAKGGIALAIAGELGIPVKLIGVGEALEDLRPFDPGDFARALLT